MISNGTRDALSKRIEFTYQVGDQIGHVWDAFLQTSDGQAFEWKSDDSPEPFGQARGSIRIKPSQQQTEKASVSITLKPSGQAFVSIAEWQLNDLGDWEEDSESVEVTLDPSKGADTATAHLISVMISSGSNFGGVFRNFIERSFSKGPGQEPRRDLE